MIAGVIRDGFGRLRDRPEEAEPIGSLTDLIAVGESQTLEFKSTVRWDLRAGQVDKRLEHAIVKTVCGFLNAEGGKLLIGVDDNGTVLGLADDFRSLGSKGGRDGFELYLRQAMDNNLSVQTANIVRISFDSFDGRDVCVVSVASSGRPAFSKPVDGGPASEFWVRIGNATRQLHGIDMVTYQEDHWG